MPPNDKIISRLDPHLALKLLQSEKEARLKVLQHTRLFDQHLALAQELSQDVQDIKIQMNSAEIQLTELRKQSIDAQENHDIQLRLAQMEYQHGHYKEASELMQKLSDTLSGDQKDLQFYWGKFACDLMAQNLEASLDCFRSLKEKISNVGQALPKLQQQIWLMHWSLFLSYNEAINTELLLDTFLSYEYQMAIQNAAPHLMRYVVASFIVEHKGKHASHLKEVLYLIKSERALDDPFVAFMQALYVDFSFDVASQMLKNMQSAAKEDIFLQPILNDLMFNARVHLFEVICRVYHRLRLTDLETLLCVSLNEVQPLLAQLLNNSKVKAQVQGNYLQVSIPQKSVRHEIIEKSKEIANRSRALLQLIETNE